MAILPARSSRARSERAADEALRLVQNDPNGPINKFVCWGAVLYVLRQTNVISKATFEALVRDTRQDDYHDFLPATCPRVENVEALMAVPRGSILGFIKQRSDGPFLAHAMLYVGDGRAVGLNNGAIGQLASWSVIDLGSPNVANWGGQQSFSYQEIASTNRVSVDVYYRDIDDMTTVGCVMM